VSLKKITKTAHTEVEKIGGSVTGVTVAIDVGEWVTSQLSLEKLTNEVALAASLPPNLVSVIPVQFPGRLLHAKANAAIRPGDQQKKGFIVVTSGNATQRGLGLVEASNLELATTTTDVSALANFERLIGDLAKNAVSPQYALKHDTFLLGLALFSSGVFYHRWQGSLSAEIRFKLTLTAKGRKARASNAQDFRGFLPDGDTISRDPLGIESIFKKAPKPFPRAFWRTYSVDTLLGYWLPRPIAVLVDRKLSDDVEPYMDAIQKCTTAKKLATILKGLNADVEGLRESKLIKEDHSAVTAWADRVADFRQNRDLIKLRIYPYTRVPEILNTDTRTLVLEAVSVLRAHLDRKKKHMPTKKAIDQFLRGDLTPTQLNDEWEELAEIASKSIA
jgi:hypothetical protein